jgi:hypothetical protein
MTPRLTKLAALYLLLGLVATWAVAWGSAMALSPGNHRFGELRGLDSSRFVTVWERRCFAGRIIFLDLAETPDEKQYFEAFGKLPSGPTLQFVREAPGWVNDPHPFEWPLRIEQRGWPWPAVQCADEFRGDLDSIPVASGVGWIPDNRAPFRAVAPSKRSARGALTLGRAPRLPYFPYWPGLLADTLFYALLFAALHQLAAYARRARRRRHNRCTACGYDLSGLDATPCPECGHTP